MAVAGVSSLCGEPLSACEFRSPGSVIHEEDLPLTFITEKKEQNQQTEKALEAESLGDQAQASHPFGLSQDLL